MRLARLATRVARRLVWRARLVFQDGHLFVTEPRPLEPALPVLLFCDLFGLSMDYEVLMLARMQEAFEETGDNTRAVAEGLEKTAGLITSAAAIMVTVFLAFSFAKVVVIQAVGFGMALAVLLDATLVRVLLVPATMRLLGRYNWWAPRPLASLHAALEDPMHALLTVEATLDAAPHAQAPIAKPAGAAPLTTEDERELASRWTAGDRAAGQRLVEAFAPFVRRVALRYRRAGVSLEDLVQEGSIGLLKAATRFDGSRGTRLVTYAAFWVRAQINESLSHATGSVRVGTSKNERRAIRFYRRTQENDPAALATMAGITEKHAAELLATLTTRDVSFDGTATDDGRPLTERVAGAARSPEEDASLGEERQQLRDAIGELLAASSPRERMIVEGRWLDDEPKTLEELSVELGVSRERVRQIEERAS
jgi:RNA polymerase sigma-32 factor